MLTFERKAASCGFRFIIGIDEAGRGPLAGPVVAAAVLLKTHQFDNRIDDSKKMTPQARESAFHEIFDKAHVGIGIMSEEVVDAVNILNATFFAMSWAVCRLVERVRLEHPDCRDEQFFLLVDGPHFKSDLPYAVKKIIGGDGLSLSIACASIIAKVYRDRVMEGYDQVFPQYGFKQHKGYPTAQHRLAIKEHGPSMIHRRSFQWNSD